MAPADEFGRIRQQREANAAPALLAIRAILRLNESRLWTAMFVSLNLAGITLTDLKPLDRERYPIR